MKTEAEKFLERWSFAGYRARCFIQGTIRNEKTGATEPKSGNWSALFLDHPTVQLAEREGWSRELRGAVLDPVRRRMMAGQAIDNLDEVMPDSKWIEYAQKEAFATARAAKWQNEMMAQYGSMERYTAAVARQLSNAQALKAADRRPGTFKAASSGLTDKSQAMTGDTQ